MTDTTSATQGDVRSQRLPLVVYALALGTFLMGTTEFIVAGVLPDIAEDINVTIAQAGLLITAFAIGMIVGAPLMAMLTLRLPARLTLTLALFIFAAGHVVIAASDNFTVLLLARFLTAFAVGAFWSISAVVATRTAGARAMGVVNGGAMVATAVGVPLGAFASQLIGWRGTFWALAVLALATVMLVWRVVPHEEVHATVSIRSELAGLRSSRLWLSLAACATTTGGVLAAYSFISPLLTDRAHVPADLIPLVLVGFGVGAFIGSILGGKFGDAHPYRLIIVAPIATATILVVTGLLAHVTVLIIVLIVLLGFFGLGVNPVLITSAVRFAPGAPTLASSLTVSAFNTGTAIGSALAGLSLSTALGSAGPSALGGLLVALTLIPAISLAVGARHRPKSEPSDSPEPSGAAVPANH